MASRKTRNALIGAVLAAGYFVLIVTLGLLAPKWLIFCVLILVCAGFGALMGYIKP